MEEDKDIRGLDYTTYKELQTMQTNIKEVINQHQHDSEQLFESMGLKPALENKAKR